MRRVGLAAAGARQFVIFLSGGSADLRLFVRLAASEAVAKSLEHVRVGVST